MTLARYNNYEPAALSGVVNRTMGVLALHRAEFDCIAVRGVSGVMVGAPVAVMLGVPLLVVRREEERHSVHTGHLTANYVNAGERALFLDDMISSGATFRAAREALHLECPGTRIVAAYLYGIDNEGYGESWLTEAFLPV